MESLGKTLKRTRESAGISVDDAVYRAKIPRAVVVALENEDFGFFTSPLYARSFLRQYGDYIGADVEQWVDDLVPATMIDSEMIESFVDLSEPVAAAVTREKPRSSNSTLAAIWMLLFTGGLVWGGLEIYRHFESIADNESSETASRPSPAEAEEETPAPVASEEAEPEPENEKPSGPEPPRRAIIVNLPEEE